MKNSTIAKKLSFGIEEIILLSIIILNIFDFFEIISPEFDYIKKIISWTAMGLLLYRINLSKLFIGKKSKQTNILLLTGYFMFIVKDLISYAKSSLDSINTIWLKQFFEVLVNNGSTIEILFLYVGIITLIFASIRLSVLVDKKEKENKKNIYSLLIKLIQKINIKKRKKNNSKPLIKRICIIFFITISFFVVVFNLMVEWLGIAIDAPVLMIGIITYLFFIIKYHKSFNPKSFLYRFGNFGNEFYQRIVNQLGKPRSALRIVSGMLILHLVTDALVFLTPMFFGFGDPFYLSMSSSVHNSLWQMASQTIAYGNISSFFQQISVFLSYFLSGLGLLFLLSSPVLLWFKLFSKKKLMIKSLFVGLYTTAIITFLLSKTIVIKLMTSNSIYGIDFIVNKTPLSFNNLFVSLLIALSIGLIISLSHLISRSKQNKNNKNSSLNHRTFNLSLQKIYLFIIQITVITYSLTFLYTLITYYFKSIVFLWTTTSIILLLLFIILLIINVLFYVVGSLFFIEDSFKHDKISKL